MSTILSIKNLRKAYSGGFEALKNVSLDIEEGEIIALLGPNGAGKTTLISTVCGITMPTSGTVTVAGHDTLTQYRAARSLIGLVPQGSRWNPLKRLSIRSVFHAVEDILKRLSLWDKRDSQIRELSGGMKRRVLIAKALAHEPRLLFLDEPTAGVDVGLRKDMWQIVEQLRADGVTTILTTHYIEEAEAIADRIGVINKGEILLVEEKSKLMARMGRKQLDVQLITQLSTIPETLSGHDLGDDGRTLVYSYDTKSERTGITKLLTDVSAAGLHLRDVVTGQSSLEDIFVSLVQENEGDDR